jgi:bifunctional DNase/RNase
LKDSTYYAELILSQGDKVHIIDSRPSDAIALALRVDAPIFVAREVLEQAQIAIEETTAEEEGSAAEEAAEEVEAGSEDAASDDKDFRNIDKDRWNELLGKLNADDFKYKM